MNQVVRSLLLLICLLARHEYALVFGETPKPFRASVTVDLGPDQGQNPGTLFEISDTSGKVIAGAGFQGAYNTAHRSDRDLLQFFLRPSEPLKRWRIERLPAIPSGNTGFYPYSVQNRLYVSPRGGLGPAVFEWDASTKEWKAAPHAAAGTELIAGKPLEKRGEQLLHDGHPIVDGSSTQSRLGEYYFAQGKVFVRQFSGEGDAKINRVMVYPWNPHEARTAVLPPNATWTHNLSIPFEFFYTFGQWNDQVIGVTNVGTVLKFDGKGWNVLRVPDLKVSYQVYCGINFHNKLLLGHYPTGEFFEYAGNQVVQKNGWPPVLDGVAKTARELQTAVIYGGDLFVGVWPWGEVWRHDADQDRWDFVQRMFKHPEPTNRLQHPYEAETKAADKIANLWGQRVTGLLPLGDSLIITTSSKTGVPWEARFDFLSAEQRSDYGAVYQATLPGNLAVATTRKDVATTFEFTIANDRLSIRQDGNDLGSLAIDADLQDNFKPTRIRWGQGVFGPLAGKLVQSESSVAAVRLPATLRAAYVHPDRIFKNAADPAAVIEATNRLLDQAQSIGLNTLFTYFTGSSGQAYYPSKLASRSHFGEHDPLAVLVTAARERGFQIWPVVCVAVCGNEQPAGILKDHPEWGLRHPDGSPLGYLSPANPQARQWIVRIIEEILERDQPDGILLDYIRFHNRPLRLDVDAERRFEQSLPPACPPEEREQRFQAFKEAELTIWVSEISQAVRANPSGAALGMYCWGPHTIKNHLTAQIWPTWVERGYVDLVNISGYYHRSKYGERYLSLFEQRLREAKTLNEAARRPAMLSYALGVNTSHGRVNSAEEICEYLRTATAAGVPGVGYFPWTDLVPYVDELKQRTGPDCLDLQE